jgi:hypothetical protein
MVSRGRTFARSWSVPWEAKLRESMKAAIPMPLSTGDLLRALSDARPTTGEWMQTARSYALHANQAGTYDDVLTYLERKH